MNELRSVGLGNSGDDQARSMGFSQAVVANGFVFVSGQVGYTQAGDLPDDLAEEIRLACVRIGAILENAGSSWHQVVQVTSYHTDPTKMLEFAEAKKSFTNPEVPPAWTAVGISALGDPRTQVEVEVVAVA